MKKLEFLFVLSVTAADLLNSCGTRPGRTQPEVGEMSLEFAHRSWFMLDRPYDPRSEVDDPWEARVRCESCGLAYIAYEMDRDPSSGHRPICASCASAKPSLLRDARREALRHKSEQESTTVARE
jgi:hypothetical protein